MFDFTSYDHRSNASQKGGKIVFINNKNTQQPLVFRVLGTQLWSYQSVYDEATKRSRKPQPGERATTKFLFNGVDLDGQVRVYSAGATVIGGIKDLWDERESRDIWLQVTSTGVGKDTEYKVRSYKGKTPTVDVSKLTPHDLEQVAESLTADKPAESATAAAPAATPNSKPMASDDPLF